MPLNRRQVIFSTWKNSLLIFRGLQPGCVLTIFTHSSWQRVERELVQRRDFVPGGLELLLLRSSKRGQCGRFHLWCVSVPSRRQPPGTAEAFSQRESFLRVRENIPLTGSIWFHTGTARRNTGAFPWPGQTGPGAQFTERESRAISLSSTSTWKVSSVSSMSWGRGVL